MSVPPRQASTHSTVPSSILHAYAGVAFPLAAAFIALQVIVPTFYAEVTGLSLTTIGIVLLVARLWDTFTDPIVGTLSDLSKVRFGRRKIWIVASTPLILLAVWKLFVPPVDADWQYLLLWTFVIYVAGTMAIVPLNAWGAELAPVYDERNRISGARAGYGLIGTLIALLLAASPAGTADSLSSSLRMVALLVSVTLIVSVAISAWKVPDNSTVELPGNTMKNAWALIRTPGPVRQLLGSFLLNSIGNAIPATLFLLFVSYVLRVPEMAGKLLFIYFLSAALSVPLWTRIARRFGKHQTWSVAMIVTAVSFMIVPFLSYETRQIYYGLVFVTGFLTGADLVLPVSIKGDLIEWDAYTNGLRRPGLFFALWGTTTKLAFGLAIGIAFPLLELLGFNVSEAASASAAGSGISDGNGTMALALMYCVPAVILKLLAVFGMRNYPITRDEHTRISEELMRRDSYDPQTT